MNKKLLSLLFLMVFVGQSVQAIPGFGWVGAVGKSVKDFGQGVGNFASDVKDIVKPEWFVGDKKRFIATALIPFRLAEDDDHNLIKKKNIKEGQLWSDIEGADNSNAIYRKDENGGIFVISNEGELEGVIGGDYQARLFIEEIKVVSWDEQTDEELDKMSFGCTQRVRKCKRDNVWLLMRPAALIFWAALATGVTVAAKKLHDKFIKPRMDEITKDLEEDPEEDVEQTESIN